MASAEEEPTGLDTTMSHEGQDQDQTLPEKAADSKATFKSYKKKFRKMKMKFDEAMRQSNENYLLEQRGIETARRIAIQNDQILDMLLDQNNSAQMPVDKRIDISTESPALPRIPTLIDDDELASFADVQTPEGKQLLNEIRTMIDRKAATKANLTLPSKSLAALMLSTPHVSLAHPQVPKEIYAALEPLDGQPGPPSYLTPDQIDDYIESIDIKLGLELPAPHVAQQEAQPQLDPSFGNTHSPYNWLRKNRPQIFLQDGEGSEKSHGKPGALRGAGKRASIPAPSKPDSLEIVEEDGQGYDFALGGPVATKGKRKRGDEDDGSGGYHPKTGRVDDHATPKVKKPRASKKKASDEATPNTTPSTARKRKPKEKKVAATVDANGTPGGAV